MPMPASELEEILAPHLEQSNQQYADLLRRLEAIADDGEDLHGTLRSVNNALITWQEIDARWAPYRDKWVQAKTNPGPEFGAALATQRSLLEKLIARIDALQARFQQTRDRMSPEVDAGVRRRQVANAYSRAAGKS